MVARSRRPAAGKPAIRVDGFARFDQDRPRRTGAPEVIWAQGKTVDQLLTLLRTLRDRRHGAIVSRPTSRQVSALKGAAGRRLHLRLLAKDSVAILPGELGNGIARGVVAILTAGTADVPLAEEARAVLEACGIEVVRAYDVGVAGLPRLLEAIRELEDARAQVHVVLAGREGALPTVVAGLVRGPVIGVPVSSGYGRGGDGEAALNAMLQSCSPLAVVNIDAAVPAALLAMRMLATASTRHAKPRQPTG